MKRCLDCYALIRDDDTVCPYCKRVDDIIAKDTARYAEKQFERFTEVCKAAGVSLLEFEKQAAKAMLGLATPNDVRKNVGLGEINNEENKKL